jgi:hypothetical protein
VRLEDALKYTTDTVQTLRKQLLRPEFTPVLRGQQPHPLRQVLSDAYRDAGLERDADLLADQTQPVGFSGEQVVPHRSTAARLGHRFRRAVAAAEAEVGEQFPHQLTLTPQTGTIAGTEHPLHQLPEVLADHLNQFIGERTGHLMPADYFEYRYRGVPEEDLYHTLRWLTSTSAPIGHSEALRTVEDSLVNTGRVAVKDLQAAHAELQHPKYNKKHHQRVRNELDGVMRNLQRSELPQIKALREVATTEPDPTHPLYPPSTQQEQQ